jgi:hypothetical protein
MVRFKNRLVCLHLLNSVRLMLGVVHASRSLLSGYDYRVKFAYEYEYEDCSELLGFWTLSIVRHSRN